jgi:hypothetical protein
LARRWNPPEPPWPNLLTNDDPYLKWIFMDETLKELEEKKEELKLLKYRVEIAKLDRKLFTEKLEEVEE